MPLYDETLPERRLAVLEDPLPRKGPQGVLNKPYAFELSTSRENRGCSDYCWKVLVEHGAGSSIVITEVRSMQLVCVLPMPPQSMILVVDKVRFEISRESGLEHGHMKGS